MHGTNTVLKFAECFAVWRSILFPLVWSKIGINYDITYIMVGKPSRVSTLCCSGLYHRIQQSSLSHSVHIIHQKLSYFVYPHLNFVSILLVSSNNVQYWFHHPH